MVNRIVRTGEYVTAENSKSRIMTQFWNQLHTCQNWTLPADSAQAT